MEKKFNRTLVTAALPYANGGVHIGHLAGVYVPADIYVRYLRLKKRDVLFVCGSDEHGVPVTIRARKEGCTPQEVVDRYNKIIRESFEGFGISFDVFGRTTSEVHKRRLRTFSARSTTRESLWSRRANSTTTRRRTPSWPTDTLRANVRTATLRGLMATNAKSVARRSRLPN